MNRVNNSKDGRRWASIRKSISSDIGVLERIPYEITMYSIFIFLSPKDLFCSVQLVNKFFHKLLWKSMRNSKRFGSSVVTNPSKYDLLCNYLKDGQKFFQNRSKYRKKFMSIFFRCPLPLFKNLCLVGAINLEECGYTLIDYFSRVIGLLGHYSCFDDSKGDGRRSIVSAMQVVVDSCDGRIEGSETGLKSSFFHKAFFESYHGTHLVRFFMKNGDKFRIPVTSESAFYLCPDGVTGSIPNLHCYWKHIIEFMDHCEHLNVSQDKFEEYLGMRYETTCTCCGHSNQISEVVEKFLDHYFRRYSMREEKEKEETKDLKIIPNKVYMTLPLAKGIIENGWRRGYFGVGKKVKLMIRFIEEFGLYDYDKEHRPVRVGEVETESFLEGLRKEIVDSEKFEKETRRSRMLLNDYKEMEKDAKVERMTDSWCGKEEKNQRRRKVIGGVCKKRYFMYGRKKVLRRGRKVNLRAGKVKKLKTRAKRKKKCEVRKRAKLPVHSVMCF